jgi:hypothetical protein
MRLIAAGWHSQLGPCGRSSPTATAATAAASLATATPAASAAAFGDQRFHPGLGSSRGLGIVHQQHLKQGRWVGEGERV